MSHRRAHHEDAYFVGFGSCLLLDIGSRCHIIRRIRWILGSGVHYQVGSVRFDLQLHGKRFEWTCDPSEPREVQRQRAKLGVHSCLRLGTGQVRIGIWSAVCFYRQGHVARPLRNRPMRGILDRPEKLTGCVLISSLDPQRRSARRSRTPLPRRCRNSVRNVAPFDTFSDSAAIIPAGCKRWPVANVVSDRRCNWARKASTARRIAVHMYLDHDRARSPCVY